MTSEPETDERRDRSEATFDPVAIGGGRVGSRVVVAAVAFILLAVVTFNLLPGDPSTADVAIAPPQQPSAADESPSIAPTRRGPDITYREIDSYPFRVAWLGGLVDLGVPHGWSLASGRDPSMPGGRAVLTRYPLWTSSPWLFVSVTDGAVQVVADVCAGPGPKTYLDVGPTVEDLMAALSKQAGVGQSGPTDVTLGGYPAKKIVLTMPDRTCPGGPDVGQIWADSTNGFFALANSTATIYAADVAGDRLVITSLARGATDDDLRQLDLIIDSIDIIDDDVASTCEFDGSLPCIANRTRSVAVEDIPLTFVVPTSGWGQVGRISLKKDVGGSQRAEAMLYWTTFPEARLTEPCGELATERIGPTAADLAAAVANTPGTEVIAGPSRVKVGGLAATHVVVTVREDLGCDPGFFFSWHFRGGGAIWPATEVGDTIRIWVVKVGGTRLFIAGETHPDTGFDPMVDAAAARIAATRMRSELDGEIQQIVDSIRFMRRGGG